MKKSICLTLVFVASLGYAQNSRPVKSTDPNSFYYYVIYKPEKQKLVLDYLDNNIGKADSVFAKKFLWKAKNGKVIILTDHNITMTYTAPRPDTSVISKLKSLSNAINKMTGQVQVSDH